MTANTLTPKLIQLILLATLIGALWVLIYWIMEKVRSSNSDRLSECGRLVDDIFEEELKSKQGDPYASGVISSLVSKVNDNCGDVYAELKRDKHVSRCRAGRDSFHESIHGDSKRNPFTKYSVDDESAALIQNCPELKAETERALAEYKEGD